MNDARGGERDDLAVSLECIVEGESNWFSLNSESTQDRDRRRFYSTRSMALRLRLGSDRRSFQHVRGYGSRRMAGDDSRVAVIEGQIEDIGVDKYFPSIGGRPISGSQRAALLHCSGTA